MNAFKRWIVYRWFILPMFHKGALSEESLKKFSLWAHLNGIKLFGQSAWRKNSRMISEKLAYLERQFKL